MNLILLDPEEICDGQAMLTERRAEHIRRVIRPAPGQTLRVGVVRGARGTARVVACADEGVRLAVTLQGAPVARPPTDLVLAVPRPKVLRRVLRVVGAMGVGRLELVNAWRVEKSFFQSAALSPEALEAELRRGAEQGASPWVPEHAVHPRLMPYLDEALPRRAPAETRVLAHPGAADGLEAVVPPGETAPLCLAVGPEGGWIPREVDTFVARGFRPARLGDAVLDVAAAVAALLGQVGLLRRLDVPSSPANPCLTPESAT